MAPVTITDVRKSYGALEVVHGVSIEIPDGDFVVLVGPSGCGKSTLLRMIAGLEEVTGGEIRIGDTVVNDALPRDRDVAMVFQSYALYPLKSVFDNMAFGLKMRRHPRGMIDERVTETSRTLELSDYLKRLPKELSGGQRQRVAMGRAIVRAPKVFLFDEPLSNLDARLRAQMRIEIALRHERLRTTSIYVTHDQVEAMTMADRIAVMQDGIVEQFGTPMELYDTPANLFVASFLGSPTINLFEGRLRRDGGAHEIAVADRIALPVREDVSAPEGTEVVCGIRPEALRIESDGPLRARVSLVEMMGPNYQVTADAGGTQICLSVARGQKVTSGDIMPLGFDPGAVHLFDKKTGVRI